MKMESEITYAEVKFPVGSNQKEEKKTDAKTDFQTLAEKKTSPKLLIPFLLILILLAGLVALMTLYFQAFSRVQELERQKAQLQAIQTKMLEYVSCKNRSSAHYCSQFFSWVCPIDWRPNNGTCYFFSEQSLSWEESRSSCQSNQANLVIITDRTKQVFIGNMKKVYIYWIGMTNNGQVGNWTWVDGNRLQPETFWNCNQPDNSEGKEHCGTVIVNDKCGDLKDWNDDECEKKYKFICEKEAEDIKMDFTP